MKVKAYGMLAEKSVIEISCHIWNRRVQLRLYSHLDGGLCFYKINPPPGVRYTRQARQMTYAMDTGAAGQIRSCPMLRPVNQNDSWDDALVDNTPGGVLNAPLHIGEELLKLGLVERSNAAQPVIMMCPPSTSEGLKLQAFRMCAIAVPGCSACGNPPTGGGDAALTMQFQFDALGAVGILCGTSFQSYSMYKDEPQDFNFGGWLLNIAIGIAIAALCFFFIPVAAIAVAATAGALIATAAVAVSDASSGNVRSPLEVGFGAAVGALSGAVAGAAIMYAPAAGSLIGPYVSGQIAGILGSSVVTPAVGLGITNVVTGGFMAATGLNAAFTANNIVAMNSGYDHLGSTLFKDHPDVYMGTQLVTALASMQILEWGMMYESLTAQAPAEKPKPRPVNKNGEEYPDIIDLKTGEQLEFPEGELLRVPSEDRVPWYRSQAEANLYRTNSTDILCRKDFIDEWYRRGFETPPGGWDLYEIHHILPREFGGSSLFENLTPVLKQPDHRSLLNPWWMAFGG